MQSANASQQSSAEPCTVLCYGDSNTWGASADTIGRLPYSDRWTTHLQQMLGSSFVVVPEGLNGRTTVHDDPVDCDFVGVGGVNLNGRRYLMPCLHSHKPVHTVVLALGCNDLKTRFGLTPGEIRKGLHLLISDIKQSGTGPDGHAPAIVVVSPSACRDTAQNSEWGFEGCGGRSRATALAYKAECSEQALPFVDLSSIPVGKDGIHFNAKAAQPIADLVGVQIEALLQGMH